MNNPQERQPLGRIRFLVQIKNVGDAVFLQNRVAPIHLTYQLTEPLYSLVLVVDNASLQVRQTFKRKIVYAKLRIDQGNLCLRWAYWCRQ